MEGNTSSSRLCPEALVQCRYSKGETQGQGQECPPPQAFSLLRPRLHGADSGVQQHLFLHVSTPWESVAHQPVPCPTHPCRVERAHLGENHLPSGSAVSSVPAIWVIDLGAYPRVLSSGGCSGSASEEKADLQAGRLALAQSFCPQERCAPLPSAPNRWEMAAPSEGGGAGGCFLSNTPC